jgi:hypothetical protein
VRLVALPNSPTPTAWWPLEDQRTSTGTARALGSVTAGRDAGSRGGGGGLAPTP